MKIDFELFVILILLDFSRYKVFVIIQVDGETQTMHVEDSSDEPQDKKKNPKTTRVGSKKFMPSPKFTSTPNVKK